jgi:hypothetical protein
VTKSNYWSTHFTQYGSGACDKFIEAKFNDSRRFQGECRGGFAEIDVYLMFGGLSPTKDLANPPSICNPHCACTGRKCGWKFTVPCVEGVTVTKICENTNTTFNTIEKETPVPTTAAPTPTAAPTVTPGSLAPTICEDGAIVVTEHRSVSSLGTSNGSIPIEVVGIEHSSTVTFTVQQTFYDGSIPAMAILYFSEETGGITCEERRNAVNSDQVALKKHFKATCQGDTATVTVFVGDTKTGDVLDDTDTVSFHPACASALSGTERFASYTYDVPCENPCDEDGDFNPAPPRGPGSPTAGPSAAPSGEYCVEIEKKDPEHSCQYGADFIQHVSSNGTHVTFDLLQTFKESSVTWIATSYREYNDSSCGKFLSVTSAETSVERITTECVDDWATVEVFVHDSSFLTSDNAEAPYICNSINWESPGQESSHTCGYNVQIPCVDTLSSTCEKSAPSPSPTFLSTYTETGSATRVPTVTPTSSPTFLSTYTETGTATRPPTTAPTLCPTVCIETGEDNVKEECYDLLVGEAGSAGKVCIEIVDDATKFQVTYTASGDWTLTTTQFWIGDNISAVPVDDDGALDTENFPYFYCNSTGEESWVSKFDMKWQYNCLDMDNFTLAVVGQAIVAKYNATTGEVIEETEVVAFAHEYDGSSNGNYFGWFDIEVSPTAPLKCFTQGRICRVGIAY